jgi:PST family polysaccharide transporter
VWRPRLAWSGDAVRYFVGFGARSLLANLSAQASERLDSLWTGLVLGTQPLGFYSRALTFAGYPRRVIANAVNAVSIGTFAELKKDVGRLATAAREVNALLLWVGFFSTGLLAVVSREFVVVLLGDRWLPMLAPFRLLLVFAVVAPIERSLANLLTAVGEPGAVGRARLVRLAVLAGGLLTLGPRFGIAGVAVAASTAASIGVLVMLARVQRHVEVRPVAVAAPPAFACLIGAACALVAAKLAAGPIALGLIKGSVFTAVFATVFLIAARRRLPVVRALLTGSSAGPSVDKEPQ